MNLYQQKADFKIAYDGTWYHDGAPVQRAALAKLFSDRALKIDDKGLYWLQTPFEKYPVEVEDVPYIMVDYFEKDGSITLTTNMEEQVVLSREQSFDIRNDIPYVEVRDGLFARLSRSVFYNMIEELGVEFESNGVTHRLGDVNG